MATFNVDTSQYVTKLFAIEDQALKTARIHSQQAGLPPIQVQAEEGRFLQFIVRACGARRALEIGTLGGYSGIWIARGLPEDGKLITLEKDNYHASIAQEHFTAAGVAGRVEIRIGNAHESLREMDRQMPFDFIFIDAEKTGYADYYDWAVEHLRPGGVIAAHNAFRHGAVIASQPGDEATEAMRAFNRQVARDPRLLSTIYPAGDGTLVAVKQDSIVRGE